MTSRPPRPAEQSEASAGGSLETRFDSLENVDAADAKLKVFLRSRRALRLMLSSAAAANLVLIAREVYFGEVDGAFAALTTLIAAVVVSLIVIPAEVYGRSRARRLQAEVAELEALLDRPPEISDRHSGGALVEASDDSHTRLDV